MMADGHDSYEQEHGAHGRALQALLWRGNVGDHLAQFIRELIESEVLHPEISPQLVAEGERLLHAWAETREES